jgi:sec-independent protein translocase protein TatA
MELIIVLVVVLLLFGSTRLPKLARSIGEASKEFKKGVNEGAHDDDGKDDRAAPGPQTDASRVGGGTVRGTSGEPDGRRRRFHAG